MNTGHDHLSKEITGQTEHNIIYVFISVISVIIMPVLGLDLYIVFITKFYYIVPCAQTPYGSKSATAHAISPSLNRIFMYVAAIYLTC